MTIAERFGANLKRHRRRSGLSQEELAFLASLHRTAIGLLEAGERLPRLDTIAKLAGALTVEPGALFDGIEWVIGGYRSGSFAIESTGRQRLPQVGARQSNSSRPTRQSSAATSGRQPLKGSGA
jgi:transcriptional regulator with XRE-family HTH domain